MTAILQTISKFIYLFISIFKLIYLYEKCYILIQMSVKYMQYTALGV